MLGMQVDEAVRGKRRMSCPVVEESVLAALLRKTQTLNGCPLRFGLGFFSRLASMYFEQAARIDCFNGL
ncbi:hypothetical protein [Fundidesulfovibrio butyratiphilus]